MPELNQRATTVIRKELTMSKLVSSLKKATIGALAVAVVSTSVSIASTTSAEAQWRPRHVGGGYGYRPHRGNRGAAVAAGIIGGLAAGALIAGAARPAYAAPSYNYGYAQPSYGYQPVYNHAPAYGYEPAYGYQPTCRIKKVREQIDFDTVVVRRVRVCR
jgi:hypothetical protein